jgi:tetratricopeptide (TPR) repeat protein
MIEGEGTATRTETKGDERMDPKKMSRRVLQELAQERASHGFGAAAVIDRRLGKCEGYLSRVLRGELGLHIDTLFQALEALGADPADFFGRAVGVRARPERLLRRLDRRIRRLPASVLRVQRFVTGELEEEPPPEWKVLAPGKLRNRLERLEERRFIDPRLVMEPAEELLVDTLRRAEHEGLEEARESGTLELLCGVLGLRASLYRVEAKFDLAARCLRIALELSLRDRLHRVRPDLLQKTCYLFADQGEYQLAIELASQACEGFLLINDLPGVGKALASRAIMHKYLGDSAAAVQSYEASLSYLPEKAWQSRVAAYQGLAWIHLDRGETAHAEFLVGRAEDIMRIKDGPNWGKLIWLRGEIALRQGDAERAEEIFRSVRERFGELGDPFELALISLRLARALLHSGKVEEVQRIASEMITLLRPLQENKVAAAAIQEFTRAALTGQLTSDLLDRAGAEISRARRVALH